MALYVRHSAWLNAAPEPEAGSKIPPVSRRESLKAEDIEPEMPPLEWGGYLVEWLFEFGPTMAAGMGNGPLTAGEIQSWQDLLGLRFQPWEARLLRRLSLEYASESALASKPDRPAPYEESSDAARLHEARMRKKLDAFLS